MKAPTWLPGLVLFIGVMLISINFWYVVYIPQKYKKEGFDTQQSDHINNIVTSIITTSSNEGVPSDSDAAQSYRTVLLYMKGNTLKGLKIINDFNTRVYGQSLAVPDTYDPRNLLDGFINPITGM